MLRFYIYSKGTDINDRSIFLNPCAFCASIGSSSASCSRLVVTKFILFVFATLTLISSWHSSFLRYLCLLARNKLVAAESEWLCGMSLLSNISLNLVVRIDRRIILLLYTFVTTAAAYNICLLLCKDEV